MRVYVKEKELIGISGIGKTHVAIALSNYLQTCLKLSVAYIEVRNRSKIDYMFDDDAAVYQGLIGFKKDGVTYYTLQKLEEIQQVFTFDYDVIIVELACLEEAAGEINSILRQLKLINIISMEDYRKRITFESMRIINRNDTLEVEHYVVNGCPADKKEFLRMFGFHLRDMPYISRVKDFSYEDKEALWSLFTNCVRYSTERSFITSVHDIIGYIKKTLTSLIMH